MFCTKCGAKLNDGVCFCSYCGADVRTNDNANYKSDSNNYNQARNENFRREDNSNGILGSILGALFISSLFRGHHHHHHHCGGPFVGHHHHHHW